VSRLSPDIECRSMRRCQRRDLTAETRVIMLSVKQTAPPMRMAASLLDLLELPSYNIYRPRNNRAADTMISKSVDILFMKSSQLHVVGGLMRTAKSEVRLPVSQQICLSFSAARIRRGAAQLALSRVSGRQDSTPSFNSEPQAHRGCETGPVPLPVGISIST